MNKIFIPKNQHIIEKIGFRELNKYNEINDVDRKFSIYASSKERKQQYDPFSKYHAVNVTGHKHTIEFRFFRCTLDIKEFVKDIMFAADVVNLGYEKIVKKYEFKRIKSTKIKSILRKFPLKKSTRRKSLKKSKH